MSSRALSPPSLDEVVGQLAADPGIRPIAGCTDVMVAGAPGAGGASGVVDLLRVHELAGVRVHDGIVDIGATTSFAQLGRHPEVRRVLPIVADVSAVIGGWQIQARATVGGNIANASPAGDSLPVWLALGATVVVRGARGARLVPYDGMHTGYRTTALEPGEIIERLHVPMPMPDTVFWFRKLGTRQALAIGKVVVAGAIRMADGRVRAARVAAGSVAALPIRLPEVERLLAGRVPTPDVADEAGRLAAESVQPIDDVRSTAAYRRYALQRIIRRLVLGLCEPSATGTA